MASEPKTPPPRRDDDPYGVDHASERRRYPDMKRTLGSLALILVPLLFGGIVWFAINDRDGVIRKADQAQLTANEAKVLATQALQAQATQSAVANANWQEVLRRLEGIETDLKQVKRNTQ